MVSECMLFCTQLVARVDGKRTEANATWLLTVVPIKQLRHLRVRHKELC